MTIKILLTIGIVFYGLAVPIMEINSSHVFDPKWVPHARLHEVWQLITNSSIAAYSLWLVWGRSKVWLPGLLGMFVTVGFLVAYAIRETYGGSMVLSDGSEKTVAGINLGLAGFGLAVILTIVAVIIERIRESPKPSSVGPEG